MKLSTDTDKYLVCFAGKCEVMFKPAADNSNPPMGTCMYSLRHRAWHVHTGQDQGQMWVRWPTSEIPEKYQVLLLILI